MVMNSANLKSSSEFTSFAVELDFISPIPPKFMAIIQGTRSGSTRLATLILTTVPIDHVAIDHVDIDHGPDLTTVPIDHRPD